MMQIYMVLALEIHKQEQYPSLMSKTVTGV